jgi:hypothetical protein
MHPPLYPLLTMLLALSVTAKTDLTGCTKTDISSPAGASYAWIVPNTGELCEFLDCGGGRAPPKLDVPGCAAYTGTATYSPRFMAGFTAAAKVGGDVGVGGTGSLGGSLGGDGNVAGSGSLGGNVGFGAGLGAGAAMTGSAAATAAAVANGSKGNGQNRSGDGLGGDESTMVNAASTTTPTTQAVGSDQGSMTLWSAIGTSRPASTSQGTASPSSTGSASAKSATGLATSTGSTGAAVPTGSMSMSRSMVKTVPTFTNKPVADGADERKGNYGTTSASTSASLVASTGAAGRIGVFGGVSVVAAILGVLIIL